MTTPLLILGALIALRIAYALGRRHTAYGVGVRQFLRGFDEGAARGYEAALEQLAPERDARREAAPWN